MNKLTVNTLKTTTANLDNFNPVIELLKSNTNLELKGWVGTTRLMVTTHNYMTKEDKIISVVTENGNAVIVMSDNTYHTLVGDVEINTRKELDALVGMELVNDPGKWPHYRKEGKEGKLILTRSGIKVKYGHNELTIDLNNRIYEMWYNDSVTTGELDDIWELTMIKLINKIMSA